MRRLQRRIVLNSVCELGVLATLLWLAINFKRLWGAPTQRGFFCDDATLKLPYHEDTVSKSLLYAIGLYTPVVVLLLLEAASLLQKWRQQRKEGVKQQHMDFTTLYNGLVCFLFGFAAERLLKALGKHIVGRLRPHFMAVCQPQLADGTTCAETQRLDGVYLEDYSCRAAQATPRMLHAVHLSFPSGHAGLSFYGMIFIVLYLERHFAGTRARGLILLRHAVQLACVLLAWFVSLSRVMDNMHHWSDVLAGMLLGTTVAIVISRYVALPREDSVEKMRRKAAQASVDLAAVELAKI